jgi:hypothetical protein
MPLLSDDRDGVGSGVGVGVGIGAGVGVGVDVGVGVGVGVGGTLWASAGVAATAKVNAKVSAMALTRPRPMPVLLRCEDLGEQRINMIPKKAQARRKMPISPSAGADLRPVLPERQSVMVAARGRLAVVVVPLPQVAHGQSRHRPISAGPPQAC